MGDKTLSRSPAAVCAAPLHSSNWAVMNPRTIMDCMVAPEVCKDCIIDAEIARTRGSDSRRPSLEPAPPLIVVHGKLGTTKDSEEDCLKRKRDVLAIIGEFAAVKGRISGDFLRVPKVVVLNRGRSKGGKPGIWGCSPG